MCDMKQIPRLTSNLFLKDNYHSILGDEMPKEDVQKLLIELAPKEDDEGFIPYMPFLEKLCGKA